MIAAVHRLLVAALFLLLASPLLAQEKLVSITPAEQAQAIETICGRVNRFYVFPEVAKRLEAHLRERLAAGAFHSMTEPRAFADGVTREMRAIANDKHLGLFFGANPDLQPKEDAALRRVRDRLRREDANYGIDKIEILEGNVGYLRIRTVMFFEPVKDILASAMAVLANTGALILDVRGNRGGDPQYMAWFFSYFFEQPTHTTSVYWRDRDRTTEFRTVADVPGRKQPDLPLYVLIDRDTFSGAEEFAYDLQARKRATIVGETSAGGANPASSFVVYKDLRISIPLGRAINPVTGTNWEGVGVRPDIEAERESALVVASEKAREAARNYLDARQKRVLDDYRSFNEELERAGKLFAAGEAAGAIQLLNAALKHALERSLQTQASINQLGYDALGREQYPLAIALFAFNTWAFPNSANTFDSLGEAYLRSGDKARARDAYLKALSLDPNSASAKQALQQLGK